MDFNQILGQEHVKRAAEIAMAGKHSMLLIGPPGCGKTMFLERMYQITSKTNFTKLSPSQKPTEVLRSLIGMGPIPKVVLVDGLQEYRSIVIQSIAKGEWVDYQMILAMRPCACGLWGSILKECTCSQSQLDKYWGKFRDGAFSRMQMVIKMTEVSGSKFKSKTEGEKSQTIRERVIKAQEIQRDRYRDKRFNAHMTADDMEQFCDWTEEMGNLIKRAVDGIGFSGMDVRYVKCLARTIADLDEEEEIKVSHVCEAIQYRMSVFK
jgi:magnesium chelatase family protein